MLELFKCKLVLECKLILMEYFSFYIKSPSYPNLIMLKNSILSPLFKTIYILLYLLYTMS